MFTKTGALPVLSLAAVCISLGLPTASHAQPAGAVEIQIKADQVASHVSPMLYGLMTEEINYSYDGGLYGELLRNRAFLDDSRQAGHWTGGGEGAAIVLERTDHTAARPVALRIRGGAANDGYWGIPIRPSTAYRLTLWAKA